MSVVAAIRADGVNLPLVVHVLGAGLLVGALVLALLSLTLAWRRRDAAEVVALERFGFGTLLLVALPAFVVMRLGALWVYSEQGWEDVDDEPAWLGVGYVVSEPGAAVLVAALVLGWFAGRRGTEGRGLARAATVLVALLLVAYLVAVWAMTTKPD